MLFNSDVFLFVFLPLTLTVFYLLGGVGRTRLAIFSLVIASLVYYSWWNPAYLPLIFGSMLVNFLLGQAMQRGQRTGNSGKAIVTSGVILNLGLLGYFKYANFFIDNVNAVTGTGLELAPIVLPLAISFFTFQQIAYLIDVYQGKVKEVDLLRYALFVTFFPQLIAGPIVHHKEMMPQFAARKIGYFQLGNLLIGGMIFFMGMFKKVVLADNVAPYATKAFNLSLDGGVDFVTAWTGVLAYTCQIYFDFSGYSDMAIGLARMFGICLPLNFNSPYKATGIIDFWRRWHMTLSRFLRDYLYIPLGGNRLGPQRRYLNMAAVMLLGGLWHGAGWNFVIWGGLHGIYLGVNHAWRAWRGEQISHTALARGASRLLTFAAVVLAWVFFRAETPESALTMLASMAGVYGGVPVSPAVLFGVADKEAVLLIVVLLGIAFYLPNTQQFMQDYMDRTGAPRYRIDTLTARMRWLRWRPSPVYALALATLTAATIMSLWQPSEFIYYQF